ncbi:MAG: hypothetical protein LUD03_06180 [Firmicutes bacterium]|nr:hypothetical protein [Bacillota bacterium]
MVELLIGKKGNGKTKTLVEKVNTASTVTDGNVVFVCHDMAEIYDIKSTVRMCETSPFDFKSYNDLLHFIEGIISGNFDITNIFVDGIFKIIGSSSLDGAYEFLEALQDLSREYGISFVISMSIDADEAPDYIKELA